MKKTILKSLAIVGLVIATSCASKPQDVVEFDVYTNSNGEPELIVEEIREGVSSKNTYTGKDAENKLKEFASDTNEKIRAGAEEAGRDFKDATDKAGEAIKKAAEKTGDAFDSFGDDIDKGLDKTGDAIKDGYEDVKTDVKKATK